MSNECQSVNLDMLASGKLPDRIVEAISEMELTIEEVTELEASKPKVRAVVEDDHVVVETRVRVSIKKVLAVLGGAESDRPGHRLGEARHALVASRRQAATEGQGCTGAERRLAVSLCRAIW